MTMSRLQRLVATATANHATLPQVSVDATTPLDDLYLATPDRLAFALGWLVAAEVIAARHATSGIDALPVYHRERGWDRFVLTRRVTGTAYAARMADEFGQIRVGGRDAPVLMTPDGARLRLGAALQVDADGALAALLQRIPNPGSDVATPLDLMQTERTPAYPTIMCAVAELVATTPGLTAAREIYVDAEQIDGTFHPLHLHNAELSTYGPGDRHGSPQPVLTYNWVQLQLGESFAFIDRHGARIIYRTDAGTWRRAPKGVDGHDVEALVRRMRGWLRLDGQGPDPAVD